jgi:hypothetical protein
MYTLVGGGGGRKTGAAGEMKLDDGEYESGTDEAGAGHAPGGQGGGFGGIELKKCSGDNQALQTLQSRYPRSEVTIQLEVNYRR